MKDILVPIADTDEYPSRAGLQSALPAGAVRITQHSATYCGPRHIRTFTIRSMWMFLGSLSSGPVRTRFMVLERDAMVTLYTLSGENL